MIKIFFNRRKKSGEKMLDPATLHQTGLVPSSLLDPSVSVGKHQMRQYQPNFWTDAPTPLQEQFQDADLTAPIHAPPEIWTRLTKLRDALGPWLHYYADEVTETGDLGRSIFVSRAAIKLANIDKIFGISGSNYTCLKHSDPRLLSFVDLCGGPGGFTQYLMYRRPNVAGWGITIRGDPATEWKLNDKEKEFISLYYGPDNTGNILTNCQDFLRTVLNQSKGVDVVVADGWIEPEKDFHLQELLNFRLVTCEICLGLLMLHPGGNLVVKITDSNTELLAQVLYLMASGFQKFTIFKPYSSRPANAEKYLVGLNRRENTVDVDRIADKLLEKIQKKENFSRIFFLPEKFRKWLYSVNTFYLAQQLEYTVRIRDLVIIEQLGPLSRAPDLGPEFNSFRISLLQQYLREPEFAPYLTGVARLASPQIEKVDIARLFVFWAIPNLTEKLLGERKNWPLKMETLELIASYRRLKNFRSLVLDAAVNIDLRKSPITRDADYEKKLMKLRSKRKRNFTQWFYDNLAFGYVSVDVSGVHISQFRTGHRRDEIDKMTELLRNMEISPPNSGDESDTLNFSRDSYYLGNFTPRRYGGNKIRITYAGFAVEVPAALYDLTIRKYISDKHNVNADAFLLLALYSVLEIDNNYLAAPPKVVNLFQMELFGSPFNTVLPYFSPFPSLEKDFGSRGNFFSTDIPSEYTRLLFNPPFSEPVMKLAAERLVAAMRKRPLTVLALLPVWDSTSQREIGAPDCQSPFEALEILQATGYIREQKIWKAQVPFYDHLTQKLVPTTNMHLLILSSGVPEVTLRQVTEAWTL